MINTATIGENINTLRKLRGWSKSELQRRVGMSMANVYKHINDGKLSIEALIAYTEVFGCKADDILTGVSDQERFVPLVELTDFYPYNLVKAAYPLDDLAEEKVYMPKLKRAIASLGEREQKVLDMRYRKRMTLEETAKEFGVTRERVRQVEARALRRLRLPRYRFVFDVDKLCNELKEAQAKQSRLELENIILRDKIETLVKNAKLEIKIDNEVNAESRRYIPDIDIDDMDLSVRSYNCLARAGIRKLSDLDGKSIQDLMKIRNLGRKCIKEISDKVKKYGIEIRDETG